MTNLNFYREDNDNFMETSNVRSGTLNTDGFDYIPAAVNKSSSLTSNECLTSRSSFDDISMTSRPSTGLKIVFKRQSENKYEIKNSNTLDNHQQLSNDSWATNKTEVDLSNGKRLPTRKSARKVKFIFSDQEEPDEIAPVKKRRKNSKTSNPRNSSKNSQNIISYTPQAQLISNINTQYHNKESDDSDDEFSNMMPQDPIYQEILFKNMPYNINLQNQFIQNQILMNSINNQMMNNNLLANTRNIKTRKQSTAKNTANNKKKTSTKKELVSLAESESKMRSRPKRINSRNKKTVDPAPVDSRKKLIYSAAPKKFEEDIIQEATFFKSDIVRATLLQKHEILNSQPAVVINHSKPFPIALVEDKTNIVETKAILFIHLFQTFKSPCIGCPLCKNFMTCTEFSKHIHLDEEDEEVQLIENMKLDKTTKSYKILPYRMDSEELSEEALSTWKIFTKRYSAFKQQQSKQEVQKSLTNPNYMNDIKKSIVEDRDMNNNILQSKNLNLDNEFEQSKKHIINNNKKIEFNDWDHKENENYLINRDRLEYDQLVVIENQIENIEKPVHYFMEEKEDLLLSEDEIESQDNIDNEAKKTVNKLSKEIPPEKKSRISIESTSIDLHLSSDELSLDVDAFVSDLVERTVNDLSPKNKLIKENLLELEHAKQRLRSKSLSYEENIDISSPKPSLIERYFNLYDNLTNDVLLYICDNEFTIIPDSYVLYINNKREINANMLKKATTDYYQSKWLEQSLDLECGRRSH